MKRRLPVFLLALAITAITGYLVFKLDTAQKASQTESSTTADQTPPVTKYPPKPAFNTKQYSLTDPTSPWVVANKQRPLQPKTYVPGDLVVASIQLRSNITSDERQVRQTTADALKALSDAAKKEGVTLTLESGYRSYNFQVSLYNRYVSQQGQSVADTQSARPGHSEHQTGLAADVGGVTRPACNVEACFADTVEGKWVAANAHKYGFIIRYPDGKTPVTGYIYEPWHLRYVGTELATEMHSKGVSTMEEFFGLSPAPGYN